MEDARVADLVLDARVHEVEDGAPRGVLGDHKVVRLVVEADAEVLDYVRMPNLVDDFDLLDEVGDALALSALSAESLDGDLRTHPVCLEHLAVATAAQIICLVVELEIGPLDIEGKTIPVEGLDEECVLLLVNFVLCGR